MYLRDKSGGLFNGTECRAHMQGYAVIIYNITPPVPQVSLHLSLAHTCMHTLNDWATTHRLTRTTHPSALKKEKGGEEGRAWRRGSGRDCIPCALSGSDVWSMTKKGRRVGQSEQGKEMQGDLKAGENIEGYWRWQWMAAGVNQRIKPKRERKMVWDNPSCEWIVKIWRNSSDISVEVTGFLVVALTASICIIFYFLCHHLYH